MMQMARNFNEPTSCARTDSNILTVNQNQIKAKSTPGVEEFILFGETITILAADTQALQHINF